MVGLVPLGTRDPHLFAMDLDVSYTKGSLSQGVAMLSTSSPKTLRRASAATSINSQRRSPDWQPENGTTAMTALLTETEVSHVLRVSLATLRKWRVDKRGPRFIKIGPLVRYQLEDLREWLSSLPTGGVCPRAAHLGAGA